MCPQLTIIDGAVHFLEALGFRHTFASLGCPLFDFDSGYSWAHDPLARTSRIRPNSSPKHAKSVRFSGHLEASGAQFVIYFIYVAMQTLELQTRRLLVILIVAYNPSYNHVFMFHE